MEKLEKLEEVFSKDDEMILLQPLILEQGMGLASTEKKAPGFKVYFRDRIDHSITLLGKITERRKKERRNNLSDLLKKAIKGFSDQAKDPSGIFLLGS